MRLSLASAADRALIAEAPTAPGVMPGDGCQHIVAVEGSILAGYACITPPEAGAYAIDRHFDRDALTIAFDASLFEVVIVTLATDAVDAPLALALAYAALRWVEHHGGHHIVAIGRVDLVPFYRKLGLVPLGPRVDADGVEFELMHAAVPVLRRRASAITREIGRLHEAVDWQLPVAFDPDERTLDGTTFLDAVGERFDALGRSADVITADVLDAWFPPAPGVLAALSTHLELLVRTTPPTDAPGVIATVAEARGLAPDAIVLGAGAPDLAYRALPRWIGAGSRALLLDPTDIEYAYLLEQVIGCTVERVRLERSGGYEPDIEAMATRLAGGAYDLVVIANPNNPTGTLIGRSRLARLFEAAPASTRFWIDETYLEYAGFEHSVEPIAATHANVVVCKSLAKVYALGGLRVAYLCCSPETARALRHATPPRILGMPAQVATVAALCDQEYYAARHRETNELRDALAADLRAALPGLDVRTGRINAVMATMPKSMPPAAELVRRCAARSLFLKDVSTMGRWIGDHTVRIGVKDGPTNRQIVATIAEALSNETESGETGSREAFTDERSA